MKPKKLIAWILALILLSSDLAVFAQELELMQLPSALNIIREEAFYGDTSIRRVEVHEGTTEIRSKAFACSSLREISLPTSLEYIADDIFYGCSDFTVEAEKGSFAYNWAVAHGYIRFSDTEDAEFDYTVIGNDHVRINGYLGTDANIAVPPTIGGLPVEEIGAECFYKNASLTSIYLPDSVARIDDSAFDGCSGLKIVWMSEAIAAIGDQAFYMCENLARIDLPEGLASIGLQSFHGCGSLKSIRLPDSLTSIGDSAFSNCDHLTEANLPSGITAIPNGIFSACKKLEKIDIPENIASVGSYAFSGCSELEEIKLPSALTAIENNAFSGCGKLSGLIFPDGLKSIGNSAFSGCIFLASLTLPEGTLSIGDSAFENCSNLESIYLPRNLDSLGVGIFKGCEDLLATVWENSKAHLWCQTNDVNCTFVTPPPTPTPDPAAGEIVYRALLIGNTYPGTSDELNAPDDDVNGITAMLSQQVETPYAITRKMNVTSSELLSAISTTFAEADSNDVSLFYYNGHGANSDDSTYLGAMCCLENTYVTVSQLRSKLDTVPGHKIVIMDSCHSGAYIGKSIGTDRAKAFNNAVISAFAVKSRDNLANSSYTVMTAASQNQSSWEVSFNENFGFAFFAWGVCQGSGYDLAYQENCAMYADYYGNNDGQTSLKEAFDFAADNIEWITGELNLVQNIQYYGNNDSILWASGITYESGSLPGPKRPPFPTTDTTTVPTSVPTTSPTGSPTTSPSTSPTGSPTASPSTSPTGSPAAPTPSPTPAPTPSPAYVYTYETKADYGAMITGVEPAPEGVVNIPASLNGFPVYAIGEGVFEGCDKITKVVLPYTIYTIGAKAFSGCTSLQAIEINSGITHINALAFWNCSNLSEIKFPYTMKSIAEDAFSGCSAITLFAYEGSYAAGFCQGSNHEYTLLPNPYASDFAMEGTTLIGYTGTDTQLVLPEGIEAIGYKAFAGNSTLESVVLPDGLKTIGESAFENCTALKHIEIPDSVTQILWYAFSGCAALEEITIPESVNLILDGLCSFCTSLTKVTLPSQVESLGHYLFVQCEKLVSVAIPDGTNSIGTSTFKQCTSLKTVTLPDTVTEIGATAFMDCSSLEDFDMPENLVHIGKSAFQSCSSLTKIILPQKVTAIENYAFYKCYGLKTLYIPKSVTSIGPDYPFHQCSNLVVEVEAGSFAESYCISDPAIDYTVVNRENG